MCIKIGHCRQCGPLPVSTVLFAFLIDILRSSDILHLFHPLQMVFIELAAALFVVDDGELVILVAEVAV